MNRSPRARAMRLIGLAAAALAVATALPASAAVGALTPKGCIAENGDNPDGCALTMKGLLDVDQMVVSPDGRNVYAVGGANDLALLTRGTNGALSGLGCIGQFNNNGEACAQLSKGLGQPRDVVVSPDGKSVYVASYDSSSVTRFKRARSTGTLKPAGCIADSGQDHNVDGCATTTQGLYHAEAIAISPDGKSVYAAGGDAIVRFDRDLTTGALTAHGCVGEKLDTNVTCTDSMADAGQVGSLEVSPDGKSLYAVSTGDQGIAVLQRSSTGRITPVTCIASDSFDFGWCGNTSANLKTPTDVALSPDSEWLYVSDDARVSRFKRDTTSGALTPRGCIGGDGATTPCATTAVQLGCPAALTMSADGRSVYTADPCQYATARLKRDVSDGSLTSGNCVMEPASGAGCAQEMAGLNAPSDVDVSPDGTSVYVVGSGVEAIARLVRSTT